MKRNFPDLSVDQAGVAGLQRASRGRIEVCPCIGIDRRYVTLPPVAYRLANLRMFLPSLPKWTARCCQLMVAGRLGLMRGEV